MPGSNGQNQKSILQPEGGLSSTGSNFFNSSGKGLNLIPQVNGKAGLKSANRVQTGTAGLTSSNFLVESRTPNDAALSSNVNAITRNQLIKKPQSATGNRIY
jgi:hypothetical protein